MQRLLKSRLLFSVSQCFQSMSAVRPLRDKCVRQLSPQHRHFTTNTVKEDSWKQHLKYYVIGGTFLIVVLPGCCLYVGYLLSQRSFKVSVDPWKYKTEASWYLAVAHYIVVETGPCFLMTHGDGQVVNARIVDPLEPERGLEQVFFASNPNTRKILEIERNPRVSLAFYLPGQISYVVLQGVARIIKDPDIKKRFWKPAWKFFYPQGPEGDDCVIVQVLVDHIELIKI
ncbi:FMN-binding pyridoxamine 5'-phosphate oxidase-related protein [Galdieria sulphuraria]|uniref:FMN-binding pyridoxamine 5'-phosphate oxidase-related protein n=1 Tax=Galdieria sulphuraria TaxID=130081 RepID=M2WTQ0_GALSU|nr:FMN-binding pyridoxamine 5'-phosphate oxidase-related protein [Galdieria sulphuraria]EME27285.1 FMN-binding pyridoxamine 5'-phosphate oxidase-related protein [Galdieria sulphuraria]|eukprot:XP_005703805.1 FMN-binding pyridoxamine 5'-phosphate oxidase-related protein [Galdieria sulphuraria]